MCGCMTLPLYYYLADDATYGPLLMGISSSFSCIYLLRYFLGNDAYVWLYDPTPWYHYLADDATYGPLLMVVHVYIFYVLFCRKRCVCGAV
jgi:hypothetical protein